MVDLEYRTPKEQREVALNVLKQNKELAKSLRKRKPNEIDNIVHKLHDECFEKFDCLKCANCCSSISPAMTYNDVNRMAKHLRMKPSDFTDQYVNMDSEGDYVFKETPCPFLMPDNYCMLYEARPKACREYPHTDRRKFVKILNLSVKNCEVCPIVHTIFEKLRNI